MLPTYASANLHKSLFCIRFVMSKVVCLTEEISAYVETAVVPYELMLQSQQWFVLYQLQVIFCQRTYFCKSKYIIICI